METRREGVFKRCAGPRDALSVEGEGRCCLVEEVEGLGETGVEARLYSRAPASSPIF